MPSVTAILASSEAERLLATHPSKAVADIARGVLGEVRDELRAGHLTADRDALFAIACARLADAAARHDRPSLRRVINATGVVLHTNLGRAPLGESVMRAVREGAMGYAALEYDLARGARGHRDGSVRGPLLALTGAEDALVVNNCAAAVLLACSAVAAGREVIVSRGELVEIGGGFRIPEVITSCGAQLVEVGTTNRTHARDYARAVSPRTAAILRVHQSNFSQRGFTASCGLPELAEIAATHNVALLADLGSGALIDTRGLGLPAEPTARAAVAEGADVVMFSGDKLLGGPQAGMLVGRSRWIELCRAHPLTRALRPGRLVLAALGAVLKAYRDGNATSSLPALAALAAPALAVKRRAESLLKALSTVCNCEFDLIETSARVGGGTLPDAVIPSWAIRVAGVSARRVERALREGDPPVIARCADGALLLDLRAVADDELGDLARALTEALARRPETEHAPAHGDRVDEVAQENE